MKVISGANLETFVHEMKRMLNEGIRSEVVRSASISAIKEQRDAGLMIFSFVKNHYSYVPDPYKKELIISPAIMLDNISQNGVTYGDCDDVSLLYAAMCGSVGLPCKISLVDSDGDGELDHAIAAIEDEYGGRWLDADLTGNVPLGWDSRYQSRFDINP